MLWVVSVPVLWFYSEKTMSFVRHCVRAAGMSHYRLCGDTVAAAHGFVSDNCLDESGLSDKVLLDCGAGSIGALVVRMEHHIYSVGLRGDAPPERLRRIVRAAVALPE